MKQRHWTSVAAGATLLAALLTGPGTAFAKQGPPVMELTNNLSVPTVFVPDSGTFAVSCGSGTPSPLGAPTGLPQSGYEASGYYYVQGINTWQAQCLSAASGVSAMASFGSNLTSDALKAGTPIRVEVGLLDTSNSIGSLEGYTVTKLDPSLADNLSAYGVLAMQIVGGYSADPTVFTDTNPVGTSPMRVFDKGATFSLFNDTTDTYVVADNTPMSAEINATGAVVYGYNWGVSGKGVKTLPTAGIYTLTFNAPTVTLSAVSAGTATAPTKVVNDHTVSITFTVAASGGKGGKSAQH